jgi:hypothetical protein
MQGVVPSDNSPGWKQIDEPLLYNVLRLVDIDGLGLIRHGENRTLLEVVAMLITLRDATDGSSQRYQVQFMVNMVGRTTCSCITRLIWSPAVARLVGSKSSCSYVRACATSALKGHLRRNNPHSNRIRNINRLQYVVTKQHELKNLWRWHC